MQKWYAEQETSGIHEGLIAGHVEECSEVELQ